tara:strand:- start:1245 stop:3413 length:2169 start_codon:yes stop_codon:yes gene_type:complete
MGGVFGHMSHIYDNPYMTFGQIKDVMDKASAGELRGTEKTDGQNLFVSYNVNDGTVRAARNKGNIKAGGLTPEQLLAKFEGRGALTAAFVNAFAAFERAVSQFTEEEKLELFGPDTNIYYNAEVMDPGSANVINYDKKTFLIHRAGHAAYDRTTGKPLPQDDVKGFGEKQAAKLQGALERSQEELTDDDFAVQVNAIRNLQALGDDVVLHDSLERLNKFMEGAGVSDGDSVGTYIIKSLDDMLITRLPTLDVEDRKQIVKRIMEDYYGVIEGEPGPKKVRGLETRQILKQIDEPSLHNEILDIIKNYPKYLKTFIFPLEDIIHDFAVEMLRGLRSAFVLDSDEELLRQRGEVDKAIKAIEGSNNEQAMEILKVQMEKLKNLEGISSAAEGFVFDYDGNTYKFTGGFAPMNQILGLFKYGRKGIPALAEKKQRRLRTPTGLMSTLDFAMSSGLQANEGADMEELEAELPGLQRVLQINENEDKNIALYPGKFKPPHGGHFNVAKQVAENPDVDKLIIYVSPRPHEGISAEQAVKIWKAYDKHINGKVEVRIADITPVRSVYEFIDNEAMEGQDLHLVLGEKDIAGGRFKTAAGRREGVGVAEVPIPPQMGGVSATQMRAALRDNKDAEFIAGLPTELNDAEISDILRILGQELDEISTMAGGNVQGGMISTGSKKGPWPGFDAKAFNKRQKKDAKLRGAKEFVTEEDMIVNEVVDYLLGITVG